MDLITEDLALWYRFALLLKGDSGATEAALLAACAEVGPLLESVRNEQTRRAFLIRAIRDHPPEPSGVEASTDKVEAPIVRAICAMPEPVRSATAMFYLRLLPVSGIAALLKMTLEEIGQTIKTGRAILAKAGVADDEDSSLPSKV